MKKINKRPAERAVVLINYNEARTWAFARYSEGLYTTFKGAQIKADNVAKFYYISEVVTAVQEQEAIRNSLN